MADQAEGYAQKPYNTVYGWEIYVSRSTQPLAAVGCVFGQQTVYQPALLAVATCRNRRVGACCADTAEIVVPPSGA